MRVTIVAVDVQQSYPIAIVRITGGSSFHVPIDATEVTWWGARIGKLVDMEVADVP